MKFFKGKSEPKVTAMSANYDSGGNNTGPNVVGPAFYTVPAGHILHLTSFKQVSPSIYTSLTIRDAAGQSLLIAGANEHIATKMGAINDSFGGFIASPPLILGPGFTLHAFCTITSGNTRLNCRVTGFLEKVV